MFRRTMISLTAAAFLTAPAFAGGHSKDIVDTAVAAGTFNTLVAAVTAAGLVDTLKSEGPFTVFAPTDEAFAKLPEGTVEFFLAEVVDIFSINTAGGNIIPTELLGGLDLGGEVWCCFVGESGKFHSVCF